jgi:CDP-L-myo-inositol myo-inositolphosphotransferase
MTTHIQAHQPAPIAEPPRAARARASDPTPRCAVIVAAGKGARLVAEHEDPKPLQPLAGVPLIRRVMVCAAKAGIEHFCVVVGYRAERMRERLPALVPPGCGLEVIENPRFEEPNGVSLLAAARTLHEPFALLMSDHIFSPVRLRRALEQHRRTGRNLLAVEARRSFSGDLEDATLVSVERGRVKAIGKGLADYDAIDTGMFVLDAEQLTAELEAAGPSPSISDGVRALAQAGELDALLLSEGTWQDVDTPQDRRAAEQLLYASLTKAEDGFMARHVNRRVSLFLSTRVWRWGVTPNMVTGFTLLLGLAAGLAFAQSGGLAWGLIGATLFQLQSILDGCDGELARLLHKESRAGFWFDVGADNLTHMAVFGGIALGQMADATPGPWAFLGWAAVAGVAASFCAMAPLLRPGHKSKGRANGMLDRMVRGLSRRDFTYLLFPLAIMGWLGVFLWVAAIGSWLFALTVLSLRTRQALTAK